MKFLLVFVCLAGLCFATPSIEIFVTKGHTVQIAEPMAEVYSLGDVIVPGINMIYEHDGQYREVVVINSDFVHCMITDDGYQVCSVKVNDVETGAKLLAVDQRHKIAVLDVLYEATVPNIRLDNKDMPYYLNQAKLTCTPSDVERLLGLAVEEERKYVRNRDRGGLSSERHYLLSSTVE